MYVKSPLNFIYGEDCCKKQDQNKKEEQNNKDEEIHGFFEKMIQYERKFYDSFFRVFKVVSFYLTSNAILLVNKRTSLLFINRKFYFNMQSLTKAKIFEYLLTYAKFYILSTKLIHHISTSLKFNICFVLWPLLSTSKGIFL